MANLFRCGSNQNSNLGNIKIGTFTAPTNNTITISGLGFTPKYIIVWCVKYPYPVIYDSVNNSGYCITGNNAKIPINNKTNSIVFEVGNGYFVFRSNSTNINGKTMYYIATK